MRTITFAFHINVKNINKGGENMNDIKEIWEKALVYIRKNINSKVSYNIHISPAEAVSCDDEYFVISVPFAINKNIIIFHGDSDGIVPLEYHSPSTKTSLFFASRIL